MRFINDSLHGALDYIVALVIVVVLFTDPRIEPNVAPSKTRA